MYSYEYRKIMFASGKILKNEWNWKKYSENCSLKTLL